MFINVAPPEKIMYKYKLKLRYKTALLYFSIKLINANKLIIVLKETNSNFNILKSLNRERIKNIDIRQNIKLIVIAK